MAETLKVLGQLSPTIGVLSALYEVPIGCSCTVSSLVVCNRSAQLERFRISVAVSGSLDSVEQYLYYDHDLEANTTFVATIGITMGEQDTVRVQSSGGLSFHAYGVEVN